MEKNILYQFLCFTGVAEDPKPDSQNQSGMTFEELSQRSLIAGLDPDHECVVFRPR